MKVKALVGFAGAVSMAAGETKELDEAIARDLLRAGYIVEDKADKAQEAEIVVKPVSKAKSKKTK